MMIRALLLFVFLLPTGALAEFKLSQMVGKWAGSGMYYEPLSQARMQCRLTIAGHDARVALAGRCGSSLGAEDVVLDFVRQSDGRIIVTAGQGAPETDWPIDALEGRPTRSQLIVRGQADGESVAMQFDRKEDGTLYFLTEVDGEKGRRVSEVTLSRR